MEEVKENSEYKNSINFNLKNNGILFDFVIENNIYKNEEVPKFDTSKAEKFDLSYSNNSNILVS